LVFVMALLLYDLVKAGKELSRGKKTGRQLFDEGNVGKKRGLEGRKKKTISPPTNKKERR